MGRVVDHLGNKRGVHTSDVIQTKNKRAISDMELEKLVEEHRNPHKDKVVEPVGSSLEDCAWAPDRYENLLGRDLPPRQN